MAIEKKPSLLPSKMRISAIDRFRGFVIFYMVFAHSLLYWLIPQDSFYAGFLLISWETTFCGAAAFVFISGISLSLSYNSYIRKVLANPNNATREKWNGRLQIWIRTAWICGLSLITNIIGSLAIGQVAIWVWYVFQTIWVSRAVCYPFLQSSPKYRLIIGFLIIILSDPIRMWCASESPVLFFILFHSVSVNPFFPFVGFFFVGSALGNWLDRWFQFQMKAKTSETPTISFALGSLRFFTPKLLIWMGMVIMLVGISFGLQMDNSPVSAEIFQRLNIIPGLNVQALPAFMVHSNSAWGLYTLGFDFIVFALFLNVDISNIEVLLKNSSSISRNTKDLKPTVERVKRSYKDSIKALTLFGQQSLTVYLSHYWVFYLFAKQLWFWQWLILAPLIVTAYYFLIWVWVNGKGKGYTLDWVIGTTTEMIVKAILNRKFLGKRGISS